jgi:hypothetical protein
MLKTFLVVLEYRGKGYIPAFLLFSLSNRSVHPIFGILGYCGKIIKFIFKK